jgi:hypothetical protein
MCTRPGLKVKKLAAAAIHLPVPTSGFAGSVKNPVLSVRRVPTANGYPSLMKSSGGISPEWMNEGAPSSWVFIQCSWTKPADFWQFMLLAELFRELKKRIFH